MFRWIKRGKGSQSSSKSLRTAERRWFRRFVCSSSWLHLHIEINLWRGNNEVLHPSRGFNSLISIDPQVKDLRTELMKMRKEKAELQSSQLEASRHVTQSRANDIHGEMGRGRPHWSGNEYMTEWTKRGHECFTISISEIPWNIPMIYPCIYTWESSFRPLILCTYSHIWILVSQVKTLTAMNTGLRFPSIQGICNMYNAIFRV